MNISLLLGSAALLIVGIVAAFLEFRQLRGIERQLMVLAVSALAALGIVGVARALGHFPNRTIYQTLNIALPVLFCGLAYQVHLHRKRKTLTFRSQR